MTVHDFSATTIAGKQIKLSDYAGKVLIIVNTASKCGFTPQYEGLEKLYKKYKENGLEILGFPSNDFAEQEPGTNEEVVVFCKINYGVTFPLFSKSAVRGTEINPVFKFLTEQKPFGGFDPSHPITSKLEKVLHEKFPDYLEGDSIKWNFTKFLIGKDGTVVARYEPTTEPEAMEKAIVALLGIQ